MESITGLVIERILDPTVIVSAVALQLLFVSGFAARLSERWEDRRARRASRLTRPSHG